ncbi:MAG: DUF1836 domain-containing protein [Oscillospiraceae bacterium]|nr:DUF1836 domain-containing protein [Oscillospiraceae bacterium]
MSDTREKPLPGIEAYIEPGEMGFSKIEMLLKATGGLSLSQVCAVTGLEGSTIQNWVKRGWVAHPRGKRYEEIHIARILLINALKECIKLEHIAQLMNYVSGLGKGEKETLIKESELFTYLCEALSIMGHVSGVEEAVEEVISDYEGSTPGAKLKLRKALSLMMYACVCSDVKRRTESMMNQILDELENPVKPVVESIKPVVAPPVEPEPLKVDIPEVMEEVAQKAVGEVAQKAVEEVVQKTIPEEPIPEVKKTIAQTLREWDVSSVERIIIDHESESEKKKEDQSKLVNRPWFSRKNPK